MALTTWGDLYQWLLGHFTYSSQLYNLYSATDVRTQVLIADTTTKSGAAAIAVNKYPNAGSTDRDNPKVLRLAEYTWSVRNLPRGADNASALDWLNTLMANRDPAFAGYTCAGRPDRRYRAGTAEGARL